MWLPKDERKLLSYYYREIGDKFEGHLDLSPKVIIASMKELDSHLEVEEEMFEIRKCPSYQKMRDARKYLIARKLLSIKPSRKDRKINSAGIKVPTKDYVELTTKGSDLARKYNHWFTRLGLWGQEHKSNPLWVPISFIAGIVAAVIVNKSCHTPLPKGHDVKTSALLYVGRGGGGGGGGLYGGGGSRNTQNEVVSSRFPQTIPSSNHLFRIIGKGDSAKKESDSIIFSDANANVNILVKFHFKSKNDKLKPIEETVPVTFRQIQSVR